MISRRRLAGVVAALMTMAAIGGSPAIASAHTGEFAKFNYCPSTNAEVNKCLYSVTEGGEVILGSKKVPIVNPVVLQGGYSKATKATEFFSKFFAATNGETLSKTPQPIPGGLAGLVNCKEVSNFILRAACEWTFENGLTGVNTTLELARPASEIKISERNQLFQTGVALVLPVKAHLENPFLGSSCYIGSSSNPIMWNLTTGTTSPPAPNTPISGSVGTGTLLEGEEIIRYSGAKLVDNAWSAPGATGCGGSLFEGLLDPIVNATSGVPAGAGHNTAIQEDVSLYSSPVAFVNEH